MKTKEFIKRVEDLGFKAHKGITMIDIDSEGLTIARVYTERTHVINFFSYVDVEWKNQDKLFDLLVEYARTPIEDREEEKKFYLKHRWMKPETIFKNYLNHLIDKDEYRLDTKTKNEFINTQFTLKEIEEIKEKFDTDLADFELVEVEE